MNVVFLIAVVATPSEDVSANYLGYYLLVIYFLVQTSSSILFSVKFIKHQDDIMKLMPNL